MGRTESHRALRERWERDAIRLLCSDLITAETRMRLAGLLKDVAFEDTMQRVVYEEITAAGRVGARRLRELLPGRVTLRGFPDFALKELLARDGAQDEDIDRWFESLLDLTEDASGEDTKAMGQSA